MNLAGIKQNLPFLGEMERRRRKVRMSAGEEKGPSVSIAWEKKGDISTASRFRDAFSLESAGKEDTERPAKQGGSLRLGE